MSQRAVLESKPQIVVKLSDVIEFIRAYDLQKSWFENIPEYINSLKAFVWQSNGQLLTPKQIYQLIGIINTIPPSIKANLKSSLEKFKNTIGNGLLNLIGMLLHYVNDKTFNFEKLIELILENPTKFEIIKESLINLRNTTYLLKPNFISLFKMIIQQENALEITQALLKLNTIAVIKKDGSKESYDEFVLDEKRIQNAKYVVDTLELLLNSHCLDSIYAKNILFNCAQHIDAQSFTRTKELFDAQELNLSSFKKIFKLDASPPPSYQNSIIPVPNPPSYEETVKKDEIQLQLQSSIIPLSISPSHKESVKKDEIKPPLYFSETSPPPVVLEPEKTEIFHEWMESKQDSRKRNQLIDLIGLKLESEIKKNYTDKLPSNPHHITAYHSVSIPSMSITQYIRRLADYINVSEAALVGMMIFMKKNLIPLNPLTAHRLALTTLLLAHKIIDDHIYNNAQFSNVGGVSIRELNSLELNFLSEINYMTHITTENFIAMLEEIYNTKDNEKVSDNLPNISDSSFKNLYCLFKSQNQSHEPSQHELMVYKPSKPFQPAISLRTARIREL